jgi:hypothetical protein
VRRRDILKFASAFSLSVVSRRWAAGDVRRGKVLYFTRSADVEHSVVKRRGAETSLSEESLIEMGRRREFEVESTKDGRIFDGDLGQYDAIAFYTSGDLTRPAPDGSPPMTPAGKQRLLDAISSGKGFVGFHAAADTFHSKGRLDENQTEVDPYIAMLGGEFLAHGAEQEASLMTGSPFLTKNFGMPSQGLAFTEEWYTFKNFAKDLHVLLIQETKYMKGDAYRRPDYPCTWVRMQGRGRVFYTSLGHREDVWTNPFFQAIAQAGLEWIMGRFDYDITPNIDKVTPQANQLKT